MTLQWYGLMPIAEYLLKNRRRRCLGLSECLAPSVYVSQWLTCAGVGASSTHIRSQSCLEMRDSTKLFSLKSIEDYWKLSWLVTSSVHTTDMDKTDGLVLSVLGVWTRHNTPDSASHIQRLIFSGTESLLRHTARIGLGFAVVHLVLYLSTIVASHGLTLHQYADNCQLYLSIPVADIPVANVFGTTSIICSVSIAFDTSWLQYVLVSLNKGVMSWCVTLYSHVMLVGCFTKFLLDLV